MNFIRRFCRIKRFTADTEELVKYIMPFFADNMFDDTDKYRKLEVIPNMAAVRVMVYIIRFMMLFFKMIHIYFRIPN